MSDKPKHEIKDLSLSQESREYLGDISKKEHVWKGVFDRMTKHGTSRTQ